MTIQANDLYTRERTVGEIAASLPGATAVFRRFGLDFCCKGDIALDESARHHGIDVSEVEEALAELPRDGKAEAPSATVELIEHILARYHEVHRRELKELVRLARKVEQVHAGNPAVPRGLADLLDRTARELEQHMGKEELILFPAMARAMPGLDAPIACMRHEHDDHGRTLQELEALTNGFTVPAGACRTWQALYAGVSKLADDLRQHIHLENNVLFPRFARR
ncbi:iron-sulfur cluster repair di-iron protein [Reyranella sp.]|jgi:regulator of cell morphogenesis and NO signaling|uniref:iron-sulfur cluster repair di-iron protein n=1 Tax=Reyranella sp. TaxID=1929291 RepID=UPI002F92B068